MVGRPCGCSVEFERGHTPTPIELISIPQCVRPLQNADQGTEIRWLRALTLVRLAHVLLKRGNVIQPTLIRKFESVIGQTELVAVLGVSELLLGKFDVEPLYFQWNAVKAHVNRNVQHVRFVTNAEVDVARQADGRILVVALLVG